MTCLAYESAGFMVCGHCEVRWPVGHSSFPACHRGTVVATNRRACGGCAERYPLHGVHHVLPNGEEVRCDSVEQDPIRGGAVQ